ncbi:MAG: intein-containing RctB family protein [Candidatus Micrarchaeia archaeon]
MVQKKPEFIKINDYLWEISPSFKQGMRVPVRVYASKKLLDTMDLAVFDQASNVATLPGIQRYSYVMPDGHSGYGFPIGGVAAFDTENGVISPGGVGFDINCLVGETRILTEYGYTLRIEDMFESKTQIRLPLISEKRRINADILLHLRRRSKDDVFIIKTKCGMEIKATADHPIMTKDGMKKIQDIKEGEKIVVFPFEGTEYEIPSEEIIVSESDIDILSLSKTSKEKIITELKKRNLLPLRLSSENFPLLIKLVAYNMGDGTIYIDRSGRICSCFWGKKEDLKSMQYEIQRLGFSSKIYSRKRKHKISTKYGEVRFEFLEHSLRVSSRAFAALLAMLGAPVGNKAYQAFKLPTWITKSPKWQKRLFLAAFFGAEMSTPKVLTNHEFNFYMPSVSINKSAECIKSGVDFLSEIQRILAEFDIKSVVSEPVYEYDGKFSKTFRIRLHVYNDSENLIRLYKKIGFEYNNEKTSKANAAIVYLRLKENIINKRINAISLTETMRQSGYSRSEIIKELESEYVNSRFLIRSIYEKRKTKLRISFEFDGFEDFCKKATEGLGRSGAIWTEVVQKEKTDYEGWVYDFTINHKAHNFIANCFVVSNCGMRLVRTDLTINDVKPKIRELIDQLFKRVPSGVGATGFVKISKDEFKKVIEEGSKWAVKKGYGWDEDLKRTEEEGCMEGADASKISQRAITRGYDQIGTLGSGNHYLEIQVVKEENIFDKEAAKKLGLFPGQIVVMFHCGSRGFGHQVATDSLNTFLNVMESKYKIKILDKELACAPFNSPEGQTYFSAMKGAMNMAFANRQVILHRIREVFSDVFKSDPEKLGMHQIYDVTHNTAKLEKYLIDGNWKEVIVHRKGATRAFGPENKEIPSEYSKLGQPVIIGGSMETGSYLLLGTKYAEENTFGSTAHGSGRTMSRAQAKHQFRGDQLQKDMEKRGIIVRTDSLSGLAEEAGAAYKSIDDVTETCEKAGISKRVVRFIPIANIKG